MEQGCVYPKSSKVGWPFPRRPLPEKVAVTELSHLHPGVPTPHALPGPLLDCEDCRGCHLPVGGLAQG